MEPEEIIEPEEVETGETVEPEEVVIKTTTKKAKKTS